ncbi:MAG: hypothetical protein IJY09_05370 [Lachnospiraceae bacterium]|nr:hypothetical protein [Lachnospiraceae bacterium]
MSALPGVYPAKKKSGEAYYRASITYRAKHISLGSFPTEAQANEAYRTAAALLSVTPSAALNAAQVEDFTKYSGNLAFDKWVTLINFRDNGIYCRTPIYLQHRYFIYYLDLATPLKFDADDLFFYMTHKIMRRGGHLFVADYGMQLSLLSRYGIRSHAVCGRDYRFVNGDPSDYRYGNIEIINRYHGVTRRLHHGRDIYTAKIHINGDFIIGRYSTEEEAAAAYNKAADQLRAKGFSKNFPENYLENCTEREYARIYAGVRISRKLRAYIDSL